MARSGGHRPDIEIGPGDSEPEVAVRPGELSSGGNGPAPAPGPGAGKAKPRRLTGR
jgi:hypothetical protein